MSAEPSKRPSLPSPIRSVDTRPSPKLLALDELTLDIRVQREEPSEASVNEIAGALDYSKLSVLHVSKRSNGTHVIIDGQRRAAALRKHELGHYKVQCLVYEGLDLEQEAELFLDLNKTRHVKPFDKFRVGVTARRDDCLGVDKICRQHGWTLAASGNRKKSAACVQSLLKVWHKDEDGTLLDRSISVLTGAFGRADNAVSGTLISGTAHFLASHPDIDREEFVAKLRARFGTPDAAISLGKQRRGTEGGSVAANVSAVLERVYNTRKTRA